MTDELKQKAKSIKFWIRGLIDAILGGGFASLAGGMGIAGASSIEALEQAAPNWKTFAVLFMTGAILRLAEFFKRNPLTGLD